MIGKNDISVWEWNMWMIYMKYVSNQNHSYKMNQYHFVDYLFSAYTNLALNKSTNNTLITQCPFGYNFQVYSVHWTKVCRADGLASSIDIVMVTIVTVSPFTKSKEKSSTTSWLIWNIIRTTFLLHLRPIRLLNWRLRQKFCSKKVFRKRLLKAFWFYRFPDNLSFLV